MLVHGLFLMGILEEETAQGGDWNYILAFHQKTYSNKCGWFAHHAQTSERFLLARRVRPVSRVLFFVVVVYPIQLKEPNGRDGGQQVEKHTGRYPER